MLLVREPEQALEARAAVAGPVGNERVQAFPADLTDPKAVERFADTVLTNHPKIHGLVHCAGLLLPERSLGPAGIERMFAVEVLAPYLLSLRLLEGLRSGAPSRIVMVSGTGGLRLPGTRRRLEPENLQGEVSFHPLAHARHLMLQRVLLARELGRRLKGTGVGSLVVLPSVARTRYLRHCPTHLRLLARALLLPGRATDPELAASEIVHAAIDPGLEGAAGQYLVGIQEAVPPPPARDMAAANRLWHLLEELSGVELDREDSAAEGR